MEKKKTIGLIFLVLVLIIGGIVFYMYSTKDSKESETDNDALAQSLYSSVNVGAASGYDYHTGLTSVLYSTDITNEFKNYYGYKNLDTANIKTGVCSNYPNQKNSSGLIGNYYCGNQYTDDTKEVSTKIISNESLKSSVESIFGVGTYEPASFDENLTADKKYIYDETTSTYVLVSILGGGTGPRTEYSFVSYTKTDDSIVIIEKVSDYDETAAAYVANGTEYKITFKLDSNSDYIFYSIEKVTE